MSVSLVTATALLLVCSACSESASSSEDAGSPPELDTSPVATDSETTANDSSNPGVASPCGPGWDVSEGAAFIEGTAEVTLRKPPPLATEMQVVAEAGGAVGLYDGELLIATARETDVAVTPPVRPGFEEAQAASSRTFAPETHKLPMCYVCGPDRAHGDGLRIHCGPLDPRAGWDGVVAAGWIPEDYMADESGAIAPEFAWAALDCPTAYAMASGEGFPSILLGRQAVRIERRPRPGERCVVTAWQTGHEGRKFWSQAALLDAAGSTLAVCQATWIEVSGDVLVGDV